MAGQLTQTGDGFLDAVGNVWTEKAAKGLANRQGFTHQWRVKLSEQGKSAWADAATRNNGEFYLNVTPHGDVAD